MSVIDLNADLGEGAGSDRELLQIVSSASIACGGHAGDEETMRNVLRTAKANDVRCGAHPGYADRENFGRVRLDLESEELATQIRDQLLTINRIAGEEGVSLAYVKLHGALANMAAEDEAIALAAFAVVKTVLPGAAILAIDNSAQITAAEKLGLKIIREAYADRRYGENGLLLPRSEEDAVLHSVEEVVAQCLLLAQEHHLKTRSAELIATSATSICMHGDTPGALEMARKVRKALEEQGISIRHD